jgi:signal recognition particle subunit SRP54
MLDLLTEKLSKSLGKLRSTRKLTEKVVNNTLREIRLALLEADVDYQVTKDFIKKVRTRCLGEEVKKNLSPADQIAMIVYEELTELLGGQRKDRKKELSCSSVFRERERPRALRR